MYLNSCISNFSIEISKWIQTLQDYISLGRYTSTCSMIGPCVHLNIPAIPGIKSMAYTMTSKGPSDPNSEIEFRKQHPTFIFTWGK